MVRLILVERKSNRICADTSGPHWPFLTRRAARHDNDVEGLATAIARLLDKSLGKSAKNYIFTHFAAEQESDGYLVFDCTCEDMMAPPVAPESADQKEALYSVMTACSYVGYILRRDH